MSEECNCVICHACDGLGTVWFDLRGRYLGRHHVDDLDELELCEQCDGFGIIEVCAHCQDHYEQDFSDEFP
jgi:RecJ-like exonuclease